MQLEKAKETKQDMERCRLLAQRIAEELAPATAAVLNAETPALEKALHRAGVDANPFTVAARQADLLVLDDLGSTALNDFTTDKIFEIVDERYRSGKPLIVTTNLNPDEAWKSSIGMRRIFDRLRERCRHVVMDGESRRRAC